MKTYQTYPEGLAVLLQEAYYCVQKHVCGSPNSQVDQVLRSRDVALQRMREAYGSTWLHCSLIEIGCGQKCTWSIAFGEFNSVTAIDLDVVARGFDLSAYRRMLQLNGAYRVAKTIARKVTAADWRMRCAFQRAMNAPPRWPQIVRMDAQSLHFGDDEFDGAFSYSVFEHLPEPRLALREMRRVIKRSLGIIYIVLEPFTSITGMHDPRLWSNVRNLPLWAHLRSTCPDIKAPGVFLNRLGLRDFERIALDELGDVKFYYEEDGSRALLDELSREDREKLSRFSDQELCTRYLVIMGRK